jgi:hypothetical protein
MRIRIHTLILYTFSCRLRATFSVYIGERFLNYQYKALRVRQLTKLMAGKDWGEWSNFILAFHCDADRFKAGPIFTPIRIRIRLSIHFALSLCMRIRIRLPKMMWLYANLGPQHCYLSEVAEDFYTVD